MSLGPTPPLGRGEVRAWQQRLTHSRFRVADLVVFHVLLGVVNVLTALLASVLVVAVTRNDGNVRISVGFVAILLAVVLGVRAAARAGQQGAERRVAAGVAAEARRTMLEAISAGAAVAPGAAASFVTTSCDDVGAYVARAVPARVAAALVAALVLVVEALVDPWSALIALGVLVVAPPVLRSFGQRAEAAAATALGRLRSLSTRTLELLEGAVELRALGALRRGEEEVAAATERTVGSTRAALRIAMRSGTALDVLAGAAVGLVAMTDGFRLLSGQLSLGHALAAVLLTAEVFAPVRAAGSAFHAGVDGLAALSALDAATSSRVRAARTHPDRALPPAASLPAAVRARSLRLRPSPDSEVVVDGLDLLVRAGTSLVITGPTGSGKSTVLRAVAGAPLVASGSLLLGNAAPTALSDRQRAALLAMVDQRPALVAGTLRENLLLGGRASAEALEDAVERCGLMDLLHRSPRGLDEEVGEEGRLLSAGERTKVALARAVLRAPGVLLLDEVGAHLDATALEELRDGLEGFLASRTVLEAAHDRALLVGVPTLSLGEHRVAVAG